MGNIYVLYKKQLEIMHLDSFFWGNVVVVVAGAAGAGIFANQPATVGSFTVSPLEGTFKYRGPGGQFPRDLQLFVSIDI